jgi:hypothetical protein
MVDRTLDDPTGSTRMDVGSMTIVTTATRSVMTKEMGEGVVAIEMAIVENIIARQVNEESASIRIQLAIIRMVTTATSFTTAPDDPLDMHVLFFDRVYRYNVANVQMCRYL